MIYLLVFANIAPRNALVLIYGRVVTGILAQVELLLHLLARVGMFNERYVQLKVILRAFRCPLNRIIFSDIYGIFTVHAPVLYVLYLVCRWALHNALLAIVKFLVVNALRLANLLRIVLVIVLSVERAVSEPIIVAL